LGTPIKSYSPQSNPLLKTISRSKGAAPDGHVCDLVLHKYREANEVEAEGEELVREHHPEREVPARREER